MTSDRTLTYRRKTPPAQLYNGLPHDGPLPLMKIGDVAANYPKPLLDSIPHLTSLNTAVPDDMAFYEELLSEQLADGGAVTVDEVLREWDPRVKGWRMLVSWHESFYRQRTPVERDRDRMLDLEQAILDGRYAVTDDQRPERQEAELQYRASLTPRRIWHARHFVTSDVEKVHWYCDLCRRAMQGLAKFSFQEAHHIGAGVWAVAVTASELVYEQCTKPADHAASAPVDGAGDPEQADGERPESCCEDHGRVVHYRFDSPDVAGSAQTGAAPQERAAAAVPAERRDAGGFGRSLVL